MPKSLSLPSRLMMRWCASSVELHYVLRAPSDYVGSGWIMMESLFLCPLSLPWEWIISQSCSLRNYVQKTSHNVPVKSQDTPCSRSPLRKLGCHVNIQWLPNYTSLSGKELFKETEIQNTLSKVCALNCISLLWIPDCKVNIVRFNIPDGWKLHYEWS